jgi:hypothetical protein
MTEMELRQKLLVTPGKIARKLQLGDWSPDYKHFFAAPWYIDLLFSARALSASRTDVDLISIIIILWKDNLYRSYNYPS